MTFSIQTLTGREVNEYIPDAKLCEMEFSGDRPITEETWKVSFKTLYPLIRCMRQLSDDKDNTVWGFILFPPKYKMTKAHIVIYDNSIE